MSKGVEYFVEVFVVEVEVISVILVVVKVWQVNGEVEFLDRDCGGEVLFSGIFIFLLMKLDFMGFVGICFYYRVVSVIFVILNNNIFLMLCFLFINIFYFRVISNIFLVYNGFGICYQVVVVVEIGGVLGGMVR